MNTTFFVRTNLYGIVEETFWSNPISLVIPFVTDLHTVFDSDRQKEFATRFSAVQTEDSLVFCDRLSGEKGSTPICIYLQHRGGSIWVLALDYIHLMDNAAQASHNRMIFKMMRYFISLHQLKEDQDSQVVKRQFFTIKAFSIVENSA